jgi:aminoglycoside phosphotransferase (APT) family kinase protein
MRDPEKPLDEISDGLLEYLRDEIRNPTVDYGIPLTQLQGGYETCTYRFELSGVEKELAKPLVLRLYPQFYGTGNAVWESTIQNMLADEGYPVSRVYLTCTDMSVLGGAFLIMAFLEGELMMSAPFETIPGLLGKTHAALHDIDPQPLLNSLRERGLDERRYRLDGRLADLKDRAREYPWLWDAVDWLMENRPPESDRLSVCHGDFHPLNILVRDGRVTGVLDWAGFMVADPIVDVGTTVVLTMISAKHLLALKEWETAVEMYLDAYAYRAHRSLDLKQLDYYKVRRCVTALVDGASGQAVWQHPMIVQDLIEYTGEVTGIRVEPRPCSA